MRCCVPSCNNVSENVSKTDGISFHGFPSEANLRAAWLRALSKQDGPLPGPAVVCSQHFLKDDIYETESGLKQIRTGAIPSTVQVCMICLDMDSKLFLMSKHKLEEAYEQLTGHPPYDQGNLRQTLCAQCAQRLTNFSKFRDRSLRARALMMDLVEQHDLVTRRHIQTIDRTKHKLNDHMVTVTLGPDHCDLHIQHKQTESEATTHGVVVKIEEDFDPMSVDDVSVKTEVDNTDSVNDDYFMDPLKYESSLQQCRFCFEEFVHEHEYVEHMRLHVQSDAGAGESIAASRGSARGALHAENKVAVQKLDDDPHPPADLPHTSVAPQSATNQDKARATREAKDKLIEINIDFNYHAADASEVRARPERREVCEFAADPVKFESAPYQCTLCLEEFVHEHAYMGHMRLHLQNGGESCSSAHPPHPAHPALSAENKSSVQRLNDEPHSSSDSPHTSIAPSSARRATKNDNKTHATQSELKKKRRKDKPRRVSKTLKDCILHTSPENNLLKTKWRACDVCKARFERSDLLAEHAKSHAEAKLLTCTVCQYKCKCRSRLATHMRTHTGEKPFACDQCVCRFTRKSNLVTHMKTHTGDRPYACGFCDSRFARNSHLVRHLRSHIGVKPYSCHLCEYMGAQNSDLVRHMRTHTGEMPYACKLCDYKCIRKSQLASHMRTHP